jgi:hypothetical protein
LKVVFSQTLPAVSDKKKETGDAFLPTRQIQSTERPDEGSEKPTLARGAEDNLRKETEPMDFYSRKVFLTPSNKVFWGKGTVISAQGRDIIATIASFMKEVPNRIVISEGTPEFSTATEDLGLSRAWAMIEYLTTRQGMDRKRFSVSATSTIGEESTNSTAAGGVKPETQRMLEIVLLEGSICN